MKNEKSIIGIISIILGIIGLMSYFIGWFFFSFVDNRLYGMLIGLILSILAIIIGYIAKKQGDYYGTYGMILGSIVVILSIIIVVLTTPVSVETSY